MSVPSTVANRYEILEPWDPERPLRLMRAADSEQDAEVALLFLPREGTGLQESVWEEIRTRAETLRRHPHPLVLNVLDSGREDDLYFLVQERPRGETLLSRIRRGRDGGDPLATGEALGLCWMLCRAVEAVWPVSCHGFLNPQEVFLEPWQDGPLSYYPKIAHVGVRSSLRFSSLAFCGLEPEACLYAAPEFVGRVPITEATDFYGIGSLLYAMLTLRPPTGCFVRPSRLHPGFPAALEGALLRVLEEEPRKRRASPRAFSRTLKEEAAEEIRWEELEAAEVRLVMPSTEEKTAGAVVLVGRPAGEGVVEACFDPAESRGPLLPAILLALLGLVLLGLGVWEVSALREGAARGRFESFQRWERLLQEEMEAGGRHPLPMPAGKGAREGGGGAL